MRDRRPTIGRHRVAQRLRGSIRCWRWRSRQRQTCPSARIYCSSCQWRLSVWTESKHLLVRLDHCAQEKEIGVSREKEQEKKAATTRYQDCIYQRGRQANAPLAIVRRLELFLSSSRTFGEPHKCSHASSATAAPSSRSAAAHPHGQRPTSHLGSGHLRPPPVSNSQLSPPIRPFARTTTPRPSPRPAPRHASPRLPECPHRVAAEGTLQRVRQTQGPPPVA